MSIQSLLRVYIRGFCMGVADLIPGVSGGTIAFITGIYGRLLAAISAFSTPLLWRKLWRRKIAEAWRLADGGFLLVLAAGILSAVLILGDVLHYLLREQAHLLLAFFCGLVLMSAFFVARQMHAPSWRHLGWGIVGGVLALWLVTQSWSTMTPSLFNLFAGGAVAICAMLLPGISGSYILLVMGLYGAVITALHEREIILLLVFAAGCGTGLLLFARLLSYLISRWHDIMIAFLCGVMLGALPKLWPWKEQAAGLKIILQPNVLPSAFVGEPQILAALALALVGGGLVLVLQMFARSRPD